AGRQAATAHPSRLWQPQDLAGRHPPRSRARPPPWGGVPLDVENADGHAAGSRTGVRVAWRAVRSHTPVSGDTQIWVASSNAILEPLRPSASRRSGRIFTQPAASAGG